MQLPTVEDRVDALSDDATRAELIAEAEAKGMLYDPEFIHPLGTGAVPEYDVEGGKSLADLAAEAGVHPVEIVIDRLLASEGRELFNMWFFHRNRAAIGDLLALDAVYPGAGDAGAHAGPDLRRRRADALPLVLVPRAGPGLAARRGAPAHRQAGGHARADRPRHAPRRGVRRRQRVRRRRAPGRVPHLRERLPGRRRAGCCVRSTGYAVTLVNGEVVTEQGELTGARPGRVLREFARLTN